MKDKAKQLLDNLCEEMTRIFCEVLIDVKEKAWSQIQKVCSEIPQLETNLEQIQNKLGDYQQVSEYFVPISQLAKVHNDVVDFDKKLGKLKDSLSVPLIDDSSKKGIRSGEISDRFRLQLLNLCNWKLPEINPIAQPKTDDGGHVEEEEEYIPNYLQSLRKAVIENDIETFKVIVENPEMPPKSIEYLLKHQFPIPPNADFRNEKTKAASGTEKCSLLLFAIFNCSFDIVRYLIHLDGINLLEEFQGKNAASHLLMNRNESREKLVEEMLEIEPELINSEDKEGLSFFEQVISSKSPFLCRVLVEKHQVDINKQFQTGWTPLTMAVHLKQKEVFEQLLSLGASPTVTAFDNWSCIHEACKLDWPLVIKEILPKYPQMLKKCDNKGFNPLTVIMAKDSLNALKAVYDCYEPSSLPTDLRDKNKLAPLAIRWKAGKILSWLKPDNSLTVPDRSSNLI